MKIHTARRMDEVGRQILVHLWSVLPFEKVEEAALSLLKFSFCAWGSLDLQDFAVPWLSPSLFPYTPSSVSEYVMQLFLRFLVHIKFGCFLSFFLSQTQEILILKIIFKRYLPYLTRVSYMQSG